MADIQCKCTRCRHVHKESERIAQARPLSKRTPFPIDVLTCPKCGADSYYDITPTVAWCWASGLIELGEQMPTPDADGGGAIEIARGPKAALKARLQGVVRMGRGRSAGEMLVPGVPEAETDMAKADALHAFLKWASKGRIRHAGGIRFNVPR